MAKFLKIFGIVYGIAKRFSFQEVEEIVAAIKDVAQKFKELKADGLNVEDGIVIVQEAYDVYELVKDAYETE